MLLIFDMFPDILDRTKVLDDDDQKLEADICSVCEEFDKCELIEAERAELVPDTQPIIHVYIPAVDQVNL